MTSSPKILVVEDNDFVRMQVIQFLTPENYDIVESSDGGDALKKIDSSFDVAIVDVRMEPIDGFEFVRALRGQDLKTAVILVTGDQNPDLLSEAGKWGVVAVLMKPVQRDRLIQTVQRALQASAKRA